MRVYREERLSLNKKILKDIVLTTQRNDAEIIFVYLPIAKEVNVLDTELLFFEKIMFEICKENKIKCYSSRDEFIKYGKQSGIKMKETDHWTEEGHKAVFRSMKKIFELNK